MLWQHSPPPEPAVSILPIKLIATYYFEFVYVVCSSTSSVSTKYDPDLLKSDVAMAKNRVSRLKSELEQIKTEMTYTQRGVDTLTSYVLFYNIYLLYF